MSFELFSPRLRRCPRRCRWRAEAARKFSIARAGRFALTCRHAPRSPSSLRPRERCHSASPGPPTRSGGSTSGRGACPPGLRRRRCPTRRSSSVAWHTHSVRQEASGIGWQTDYPYAEINLTTRLSELTKTRVSRDEDGTPNFYVVRLTDDTLFNCPVLVASDAGTIGFQDNEPERLREYLLKGGFLWVDDFWGTEAWDHWASQIQLAFCRRRISPSRTCRSTIRCCTACSR